MREVAATDAKAHLAELLRAVEYGETVAITRHGKTVAHLSPPGDDGGERAKSGGGAVSIVAETAASGGNDYRGDS